MADDMVARVRELVRETFVEGALKADRDGVMPVEHVRALHEVGFSRALLPASVGGGGLSCEVIKDCMAEIAYVDPSTAVAYNMHVVLAQWFSTFPFPMLAPVFEDMVDNGATICGSVSLPSGETDTRKAGFTFRREGDGFVVDGKMGFASGSDAATYFGMVGRLEGAEEPTLVLSLPKLSEPGVTVMGNWDAIGLRGTASHDILAADLRIPEASAVVMPVAVVDAIMADLPLESIHRHHIGFAAIMGCWQGLCQATLDQLVEFSRKRFGTTIMVGSAVDAYRAEEGWVRNRLGHLAYLLETGRVILADFTRRVDAPPTTLHDLRYGFARALYHWKLTVDEFVSGAMRVGGAHGFVTASPISRLIRDLQGCAVMTWRTDDMTRSVAQGLYGEPIAIPGLAGT